MPIQLDLSRSLRRWPQVLALIGLVTVAGGLSRAKADAIVWDGEAGDGLWTTPANWSGDQVPGIEDEVSIPESAEVVLHGSQTVLALVNGGALWVQGGGDGNGAVLTISSNAVNRGIIRLESVSSTWASLLFTSGKLTNSAEGVIEAKTGSGGPRSITGHLVNQGLVKSAADYFPVLGIYELDGGVMEGFVGLGSSGEVRITKAPSTPAPVVLWGGTRLTTDNPPGVELWVQGGGDGNGAVLTISSNAVNRGIIRLESVSSTWVSLLFTSGKLTNSAEGVIE
ncbi:MAG TPA: hypothetical protein PLX89_03240, partial [Verrucomicrobiota bacterium]|nr:hypothetical protein [Verrucomicrobiota bacterium]